MRIILSIILFVFLFISCKESIEEPIGEYENIDGYYFDYYALSSELPQSLVDTSSSFKIIIWRETFFNEWKTLIEKAEACFAPKSDILEYYSETEKDSVLKESLWWYDSFDGIRIPYCITGSSLEYYVGLIHLFQQGRFNEVGAVNMISASVEYSATVSIVESFVHESKKYENVYLVELKLAWQDYCGLECALWITKKRILIFDREEFNLLGIIGDGPGIIMIS